MANFNEALKITGISEGAYANNPADRGKETMYGISRKNWPNWAGWVIVDKYKAQANGDIHLLNKLCNADTQLQSLKVAFYHTNFWNTNKLDQFTDQQLAQSVYDFGVTSGTEQAAKILQMAVNVISDGIIGPQTINAVNAAKEPDLYNQYNEMRRLFYENLATHPGQHQFLASWLSRLKEYKEI